MSTGLEGKEGKKHITRSEHENNPTPLRTKLYEEHAMKGRTTKRGWGGGLSHKSDPGLLSPADVLPQGRTGVTLQGRKRGRTSGTSFVPGTLWGISTDTLNDCMKF